MNTSLSLAARGASALWLWRAMWLSLVVLLGTQILDAWQRTVPASLWVFWFAPLLILVPGLLQDRLRSVTWLAFVSLLYFIFAVLRIFAEPHSARAQLELLAIIGLFLSAGFYVRARARDLKGAHAADDDPVD